MNSTKTPPPRWETWVRAFVYLLIGLSVICTLGDLAIVAYHGSRIQVPTDSP